MQTQISHLLHICSCHLHFKKTLRRYLQTGKVALVCCNMAKPDCIKYNCHTSSTPIEYFIRLLLTEAGRVLRAGQKWLGGRRLIGLWLHAQNQLVTCGEVAGYRCIGPGNVVIVIMMSAPSCSANVIPGSIAPVVEATEEVEALCVYIKVQDHHDEEVKQAEEQDTFTDALQSPSQHQPGHGRG